MLGVKVFRDSITRLAARAFFGTEEWSREIVKNFIPNRAIAHWKNIGGYGRSWHAVGYIDAEIQAIGMKSLLACRAILYF